MYKPLSDSTLMSMTKKEIIENLRIAEHNFFAAEETLAQQAENMRDWAPVVRCKDCWYSGFDPEYGKRWCERCWGSMLVQDDDFCSYGEKREV